MKAAAGSIPRIMGLVVSVLLTASISPAETATNAVVRTWTSVSGQTVEAAFVSLKSGYVNLRTDAGKSVQISLAMLSAADRQMAKELGEPPPRAKPAAASHAGTYAGTYRSEGWQGTLECVIADGKDGELEAAFAAVHSDHKTYNYKGTLSPLPGGKYDGLFDVRKPKEFRVNGSFSGQKFTASLAMADGKGREKTTGEISLSRK